MDTTIGRRGLLSCMALAGAGVVWTVAGGVPRLLASMDTPTGDRLHLITPQGEEKTGFALWEELVRSLRPLRLLTPLLYIPGLRRLGMSWFPPEDHDRANASPALEAHQKAKNQKVPS